ncbi:MAG: Ig-like domain-containing protein [Prevotella sp.]|jgi:N-acetylmuramoyl-L-alanine amidase|nr:Ig-like domain-containing protein [Prevotella sp.]
MKKLTFLIFALLTSIAFYAVDGPMTGIKIYLNPGHGGYDSNDRSIWTIPVPETWSNPDGYWESKSNLVKGLALRDMLQAAGATVIMSRTTNTSGIRDGAQYAGGGDRDLSEIAAEANANNVDAFLSIHSNAINTTTNYLLLLYHGYDNQPTVAASLPMVQAAGPVQITNQLTVWTSASPMLRGDFTFYGDNLGLGVLRPLTVPGFLSEGSFHDYAPETHRLCNDDYCKLEAYSFYRFYHAYFNRNMPDKGVIGGFVKSENERVTLLNQPNFKYVAGSHDQYLPLNAATVTLKDASGATTLDSYTTDNWYNGIFAFYDLSPGTYQITVQPAGSDYDPKTVEVVVEAGKTAYAKVFTPNKNLSDDGTPYVDYPDPVQDPGITAVNRYDFEEVLNNQDPDWLQGAIVKRALFRKEKLYVLTTEPKILVVDAVTGTKIKELDLTGIAGGSAILSDIAFTADDFLVACNKETIDLPETGGRYFKVYTWDDDNAAPTVLFQSQKQGNWGTGIVGETFTVSGRRSDCKVYVPAVTSSSSKQIRIVGFEFIGGSGEPASKYMMDADNYTEALWGANYTFTISRTGNGDHFYVDSPVTLPVEYRFDWTAADRSSLANKKVFTETAGYTLGATPGGFAIFRYAQHTYMASPVSNADATQVGVALFDITDGFDQAVKVSDKYPENGLGAAPSTYMAAAAKVTGVDIDVMILAQAQGYARYKTATKPTANIYASELSVTAGKKFKFTLNEDAQSVVITLYKEGEFAANYNAGALSKGVHEIEHDFSAEVPLGDYTWSITASARAVGMPTKISNDSPQFLFYAARGVAVDNNPASPFFGRVYVAESGDGAITVGSPNPTRSTQRGIYVLNAAFEDITNQQTNSYNGSVAWGTNNGTGYQYGPTRPAVAPDGKVYIPASHYANPGVWIMDPANPSAAFTPVFGGTVDAAGTSKNSNGVTIHNPVEDCWVSGSGTDTRLFTFDRTSSPVHGNINRYDIGDLSALPWTDAPSAVIYNDITPNKIINAYGSIASDARGGWWIAQYRANSSEAVPSLIHVTNGAIDYNSAGNIGQNGSLQGSMTVNADGTLLALGTRAGEVEVYSITYDAGNVPTLTLQHTISWWATTTSSYLTDIAFDAAGNLYMVSNGVERLIVYSLPKADNSFTTSAQTPYTVEAGLDPAKANVYASELSRTDNTFQFTLNDNAQSVIISVYKDGEAIPAASFNAGSLPKGVNTVMHDFSDDLTVSGSYSWTVATTATTIEEVTKISDNSERFLFWGPRGVAVDNSFESPFFGRVYASEGSGGTITAGAPNPTRTTTRGVYIFNAALDDVTSQGATAYAGGVIWSGLYRPSVAPDGKVFLADNSMANSGVWIMDPANPTAAFTPVFGGTLDATGIATNAGGDVIHGRIPHSWVEGIAENAKLFTFDAGANNTGNINRYDIGSATLPWTAAPDAIVYDDAANGNLQQNFNSSIAPDGRDGWWISQYRATNSVAIPSLIHITSAGTLTNFGVQAGLAGSYQGGMAVSVDGKLLAIGTASGTVKVFEITFDDNTNVPSLSELHSISTATGAYAIGVAFDAAGNLYTIDNNMERLRVYALPKADNSFTTPARAIYDIPVNKIVKPTVIGTSPAKGVTGVSHKLSSVSVTFSTEMDDATAGTIVINNADLTATGELTAPQWSADKKTVTFTFTGILDYNTRYTISISGFKDKDGVEMEDDSKNTFTTKEVSKDANLSDLIVDGLTPLFNPATTEYFATLSCDESSLTITAIPAADGSVTYEEVVTLDHPGSVTSIIRSLAADGITSKEYKITVTRLFDISIIRQYWDNVLAVNLNPATNGGYRFAGYQWYKDGEPVAGNEGTRPHLYLHDRGMSGEYSVELTTVDGETLSVCGSIYMNVVNTGQALKVYPNPAKSYITVENGKATSNDLINLFDINGRMAGKYQGTGAQTTVDVSGLRPGYYILRVGNQAATIIIEK